MERAILEPGRWVIVEEKDNVGRAGYPGNTVEHSRSQAFTRVAHACDADAAAQQLVSDLIQRE